MIAQSQAASAPIDQPSSRRVWERPLRLVRQHVDSVVFYLAILLVWEGICRLGLVAPYLLPAPTAIANRMVAEAPSLLGHARITLTEILIGFLLGSGIGFGLAVGVVHSQFLERVVYPFALFTQIIPKLAIAPLFIVWLGFGLGPKIAITALICLFPVLINTVAGLTSVDPRLLDLMHSVSASRFQVFRMIRLPSAMPHIFAGLQIGITLATVGALVGEWVGADAGLGYVILTANSYLNTELVFAALVSISLLGLLLFVAMVALERLLLPHRAEVTARDTTL